MRQIYIQKFRDSSTGRDTVTFLTGIDGYRSIAERTKRYAGGADYLFDDGSTEYEMLAKYDSKDTPANAKEETTQAPKVIPRTATATVYKIVDGLKVDTTATARWSEYYPKIQKKAFMWNKMPFLMLGKCAEALALRKAFPLELSGLHTVDEFQESEMISEDTVEIQNEVNQLYATLQYNEAAKIDFNVGHCGKARLTDMNEYELRALANRLEEKVKEAFDADEKNASKTENKDEGQSRDE